MRGWGSKGPWPEGPAHRGPGGALGLRDLRAWRSGGLAPEVPACWVVWKSRASGTRGTRGILGLKDFGELGSMGLGHLRVVGPGRPQT